MAKTENDIREKKEKKDKKRKADEDVEDVSAKKDKKKKRKSIDADGDAVMDAAVEVKEDADEEKAVVTVPVGALVPFANPLADEKQQKKVLKAVKKCMRRTQTHWNLEKPTGTNCHSSCEEQGPQARRQGVRQGHPQIPRRHPRRSRLSLRYRRSRRRYLPHGRHQPHSRTL